MNFNFWPNAGILYSSFLFLFFLILFYGIYLILKTIPKAPEPLKTRLKFLLIGTIISGIGGSTNFPLWYNVPILPIGNWVMVFYMLILSYAVVEYRFTNIRLVLGRTAVYVLSLLIATGFGASLMVLSNQYLIGTQFFFFSFLTLIASIMLFRGIFSFFEKLAAKYFYYTFYSF